MIPDWLLRLSERAESLPGAAVSHLADGVPPPPGARPGAVLILFSGSVTAGPRHPEASLLLIRRADSLRAHAGQIAFPGGAIDSADPSPAAAALREAQEEVGLPTAAVDVLATLPAIHLPVSDFAVSPVIGWAAGPQAVTVGDPAEVAEVFHVTTGELVDPANRFTVEHPSGYRGPAFEVGGRVIWGFTGGLLDRLLDLAGIGEPWSRTRVLPVPGGGR